METGFISFDSLRLQANPGMHIITITVSDNAPTNDVLATFNIEVVVQPCPVRFVFDIHTNRGSYSPGTHHSCVELRAVRKSASTPATYHLQWF